MGDTEQGIDERVAELEARVLGYRRSLKITAGLGVALLAALLATFVAMFSFKARLNAQSGELARLSEQVSPERLKAREFSVTGEDGRVAGRLTVRGDGNPVIQLRDAGGRVVWAAPEDGGERRSVVLRELPDSGGEVVKEPPAELRIEGPPEAHRSHDDHANKGPEPDRRFETSPETGPPDIPAPRHKYSEHVRKIGENHYEISREGIEQTIEDPSHIVTRARVVPNYTGSGELRRIEGFRIYRIAPHSVFALLGLQNGDVIKAANGEGLDNLEQGLAVLGSLADPGLGRVELTIERGGKDFVIRYDIVGP